jgi:lipopolysaccharide biosynthesis glycosyltransferase
MKIFIGYDHREDTAYKVCEFSIRKHTRQPLEIAPLEHTSLRKQGLFKRPWLTQAEDGQRIDLVDQRPFSTEFSHTRFLVPHLTKYKGWALFMDCDMVFTGDIRKLFDLIDPQYAVMVVKHKYRPKEGVKMDGQVQSVYQRKNWSSFILFNCAHEANRKLTPEYVSFAKGGDMHAFGWLGDDDRLIGEIPATYNWIDGSSPPMLAPSPVGGKIIKAPLPEVIHYTVGGPWFPNCRQVKYADVWTTYYEKWQFDGNHDDAPSHVPTTKYESKYQKA